MNGYHQDRIDFAKQKDDELFGILDNNASIKKIKKDQITSGQFLDEDFPDNIKQESFKQFSFNQSRQNATNHLRNHSFMSPQKFNEQKKNSSIRNSKTYKNHQDFDLNDSLNQRMSVIGSSDGNSTLKKQTNNLFNINQQFHESDKFDNRSGFFQIAVSPYLRDNAVESIENKDSTGGFNKKKEKNYIKQSPNYKKIDEVGSSKSIQKLLQQTLKKQQEENEKFIKQLNQNKKKNQYQRSPNQKIQHQKLDQKQVKNSIIQDSTLKVRRFDEKDLKIEVDDFERNSQEKDVNNDDDYEFIVMNDGNFDEKLRQAIQD